MKKRIIFWGTPEHAQTVVQALFQNPEIEMCAVVTVPDKPVGRKQIMTASPVKLWALSHHIPVFTPENLSNPDFIATVQSFSPDFLVVVAYGKIIPSALLAIPKYGAYNLHFSLLPAYRGASPVQSAILNGETESGITLFKISAQMDTGNIVVQKPYFLKEKGFFQAIEEMTNIGITAFQEFLISPQHYPEIIQDEKNVTECHKISKEDGQIFLEKNTVSEVLQKYRAFEGWPGIFSILSNGKRVKYTRIAPAFSISAPSSAPFFLYEKRCFLRLINGVLEIISVIPEGKKEMSGYEFFKNLFPL